MANFTFCVAIVKGFWCCFVSLVRFSYWSKFHVHIITGSGAMTIFFYKGLIRNSEIRNTPVWVLPNIWTLGRVKDTKFDTNISNEMLLNVAKCQGYNFCSQAVIILIEKKERDKRFIKKRRPISLLNVNYEIVAKALVTRLKETLPKINIFSTNGICQKQVHWWSRKAHFWYIRNEWKSIRFFTSFFFTCLS